MQLSSVDLSRLEPLSYRSKQVERIVSEGNPRPRTLYGSNDFIYKVWTSSYKDHRTVFWRGQRRLVRNEDSRGNQILLGFLYGLFDDVICPAFVEHIYDGSQLVGYKMLRGEVLPSLSMDDAEQNAFTRHLAKRSFASGFVYRDLKARNMIRLPDGRLSLIDLECPLAMLCELSMERECRDGSLARHTFSGYREFVREYLDPQTSDERARRAQKRFQRGVPKAFLLAVDDG